MTLEALYTLHDQSEQSSIASGDQPYTPWNNPDIHLKNVLSSDIS